MDDTDTVGLIFTVMLAVLGAGKIQQRRQKKDPPV